jgi:multiple antibiotic resistance protein
MLSPDEILTALVLIWAVIDPIGTIPVFIFVAKGRSAAEQRHMAFVAASRAAGILLFFIIAGEFLLNAMGVPLPAFEVAGGLVLFLFALTMIFGESKPESELKLARTAHDDAIFPLATPSLASPGAMMAMVLLTKNSSNGIVQQGTIAIVMLFVLGMAYIMMRCSGKILSIIGEGGTSIISRVMGMILASLAATNVLAGIKEYFQ